MSILELSFLGTFQAAINGQVVTRFRSDKVRALLAYLAVESKTPQSRETLAGLLWPERPQQVAVGNLRKALHDLKQALDQLSPGLSQKLLLITRQTVQLNMALSRPDVSIFRQLIRQSEMHIHQQLHTCDACMTRLTWAADLVNGELLAGFSLADAPAFEEWLLTQRESLHQQMEKCLYALTQALIAQQDYDQAQVLATRQLVLTPWHEEAHQQLMQILAFRGQRTAALSQYEKCREILWHELRIEPTVKTRNLYEQIKNNQYPVEGDVKRPFTPLLGFPKQLSPLVGREQEVAQALVHITSQDCRLLTLYGLGGIGKTRLSIAVAQRLAETSYYFRDGIFFIPLTGVDHPDLLISTFATHLGVALPDRDTPQERLEAYLQSKEMLLILDSFEHLLDGVGILLSLLATAPKVKFLVTSREWLNISPERRQPVAGLVFPTEPIGPSTRSPGLLADYHAVRLFMQSAVRAHPGFMAQCDQTAVSQICQILGGIPLAIEIAATWVSKIDCQTIATEIAHNLDFLTTSLQDVPTRHRSMVAVFEQTWQQLRPLEQKTAVQLSIFRGSFSLEAALAVTQAEMTVLLALVEKSLLYRAGAKRYVQHDLWCQFVAEKWDKNAALVAEARRRHALYYLAEVGKWRESFYTSAVTAAIDALQPDLGNIRLAWRQALEFNLIDVIVHSAATVAWFLILKGLLAEGESWLQAAINQINHHPTARAKFLLQLLIPQVSFLLRQGKFEQAHQVIETAIALAGECEQSPVQIEVRLCLAKWQEQTGAYTEAAYLLDETLTQFPCTQYQQGRALRLKGLVCWHQGLVHEAIALLEKAWRVHKSLDAQLEVSQTLQTLALIYENKGDFNEALLFCQEALQTATALNHKADMAQTTLQMGNIYWRTRDNSAALTHYQTVLAMAQKLGMKQLESKALGGIGNVYHRLGAYEEAINYFQRALTTRQEMGDTKGVATMMGNLGNLYADMGCYEEAIAVHQEALQYARTIGDKQGIARVLGIMAYVYGQIDQYVAALNCYAESIPLLRELDAREYLAVQLSGQAILMFEHQEYGTAKILNEESDQIATTIGLGVIIFDSKLLSAKLEYALESKASGRARLMQLLVECESEAEQAEVAYELWRLGAGEKYGAQAITLYRNLARRTPKKIFRDRVDELERSRTFPQNLELPNWA